MKKGLPLFFFYLSTLNIFGQLYVARDTATVFENGRVLKMPWANGLNYTNLSTIDLDFDGKKDVVAYDRVNQYGTGRFRCFLNKGNPGDINYAFAPEYSYYFPTIYSWAILMDYNNDGLEDIFCSTAAGISVYKNVSTAPTMTNSVGTISFTLVNSLLLSNYAPAAVTPTYSNIYASPVGLPGLADIDGDGDIDILTFTPTGIFAELHKNLSIEKFQNADSLSYFQFADPCWGKFSESTCELDFEQCGPSRPGYVPNTISGPSGKTYHSGACLTCLDSDGDGDQDLILGDIACNVIQYIHNGGNGVANPHVVDTTKLYPNYPAKNNTTTIKINNFPCTYYTDVDNDGKKDLIATPNIYGSENTKSVWLYRNTSATSTVNFQFVKNNFLQDEMIDVGQVSSPIVFDYNLDGKNDLLIGTYGYYANNALNAQFTLYENVGTPSVPAFSLITRDYAAISTKSLNNVVPTAGDIDNDGDVDICIGTSSGQVHWLENTAGSGNVCNFSTFHNNPFGFTTPSAQAAPQLFDMDNDGNLDLLIGMKNGRIAYYKNNSTNPSNPSFTLITSNFGAVNVTGDINLYGLDGCAAPYFYRDGSSGVKLLVGSVSGNIFYFSVPNNINVPFNIIASPTNNFNEGGQSTICFEDINFDGKRDLIVGNGGGGLSLFTSKGKDVGIEELDPDKFGALVALFPNPSTGLLNLRLEKIDFDAADVVVYDVVGKELLKADIPSNSHTLDLRNLRPGIYFVRINAVTAQGAVSVTKKIIKE